MAKMNPEVKAKWVAALRSGEYKQGVNRLRSADGFCCLGVLCDLYDPTQWGKEEGQFIFGEQTGMPPPFVKAWAGFEPSNFGFFRTPKVKIGSVTTDVDEHNDTGHTFAEIADAIEAQL